MSSRSTQIIGGPDREDAWVDATTHGLVVMGEIHEMIHRGIFYSAPYIDEAFAADAIANFLIRVVSPVHIRFTFSAIANARAEMFKNPTTTADGAAQPAPVNRNLFSPNVADMLIFLGPTITADGDLVHRVLLPAGTNKAAGATESGFAEWILPAGDYLIRVTNLTNQVSMYGLDLDFYIPGQGA